MNGWKRHARRPLRSGNVAIAFVAGLAGSTVVVVVVGLVLGMLMGGSSESADPEDQVSSAVDELFAALANESFADTYRNNTTNHFRETVKLNDYLELGTMISTRFGTLNSKTSTKFELHELPTGWQVVAFYDGDFEKGPGTIMTEFRKVDKKWLLLNFAVQPPAKK